MSMPLLTSSSELLAFISSTYIDLRSHREKAEEALSRIEARYRTMKFFGSREGDPLDLCLEKLRKCNYYIGIVGNRYGQTHEPENLSFTALEYEEAKRLGIARKIYLADSSVQVLPVHIESDLKRQALEEFKK